MPERKITEERLNTLFEQAGNVRIAVLGDLMLDLYVSGTASRLSQEAPVPILLVRKSETRPGGAANVIRNLKSLANCTVFAFGITGKDSNGEKLHSHLKQAGVNTDGILSSPDRRTTVKQRVIAGHQQIVRMDFEETEPVPGSLRDELSTRLCALMDKGAIDALILEDYAKGLLEHDMLRDIAASAAKNGIYTSLDPHPGHDMRVRGLSLMTPNRAEAFSLSGVYCIEPCKQVEQDSALKLVAERLMESWAPESLLITLGHQGMALFQNASADSPLIIPTVAREVFDVSGAGDTVISAYTLCMAAGATPEEAAEIANHAAGIVVGKAGTAVADEQEVRASFLS